MYRMVRIKPQKPLYFILYILFIHVKCPLLLLVSLWCSGFLYVLCAIAEKIPCSQTKCHPTNPKLPS